MKVGDKVRFQPAAFIDYRPPQPGVPIKVTGYIAEINRAHRWVRVTFEVHGITLNECFKF